MNNKEKEKPKLLKDKIKRIGNPGRGGKQPGAGRPEFVPTAEERKRVEQLSGFGVPMEQIAALIRHGIHIDTLRARFQEEIVAGKAKANAAVGQTLFQRATSGEDTTAAIWWSKTQMRWAETQKHEVTGADGGPVIARIERVILGADGRPVIEGKAE